MTSSRKVKIEIEPDMPEEITIRCKALTDEIVALQRLIENGTPGKNEISLFIGGREYLVKLSDVLFFETDAGGGVCAHTRSNIFDSDKNLSKLSKELPDVFVRVSKSCILNTQAVYSMSRGITGVCEVSFAGTDKKAYVSRMYYRNFREILNEKRL